MSYPPIQCVILMNSNALPRDLQIQWEVIVSLLYQTLVQNVLPTYPSIQLMVVGEEGEDRSLNANSSSLGNDTIHSQVGRKRVRLYVLILQVLIQKY